MISFDFDYECIRICNIIYRAEVLFEEKISLADKKVQTVFVKVRHAFLLNIIYMLHVYVCVRDRYECKVDFHKKNESHQYFLYFKKCLGMYLSSQQSINNILREIVAYRLGLNQINHS